MQRLIFLLTVCLLLVVGCGLGASDYQDAVLDGVSSLNRNEPEEALESFNRAISIDSARPDGYLGRANTLNTLGRYQESLKDYDRVIEIDPTRANAYVNRGIAFSQLGEYEKAIADYEKGLELDPEIDDSPSFLQRLFDDKTPNRDKGIRKHLEYLKEQVQKQDRRS